jgi:hypothetical protein
MVNLVALPSSSGSLSVGVSPAIIDALDSSIREELQRTSHGFFVWVWVSAIVVAIGVALEGPEIFHELWPGLFIWFTWTSNERQRKFERVIKTIGLWGWLLVVVGVMGEGIFEGLQNRAEGQLQTFNDILLRDARLTASTAKQSAIDAAIAAGYAKTKADAADTAAGQAQRKVRALYREAASLSARIEEETAQLNAVTPRAVVLRHAENELVRMALPFPGQKISAEICGPPGPLFKGRPLNMGDLEKFNTVFALLEVLGDKGTWTFQHRTPQYWSSCPMPLTTLPGIRVFINSEAPPKTEEAAMALSRELASILPAQPEDTPIKLSPRSASADDRDPGALVGKFPDEIVVLIGVMPLAKATTTNEKSNPNTKP